VSRFVEAVLPPRLGRGYRWLLASSWTTNLGDGIAVAAGPLLVASLTKDGFLVALAALLRWAPPLAFGLYAGVLSDRLNRRRIIMIADGVRAVALGVLVVTMMTGRVTVTMALVALGLLATAEVFADNTATTLAPMLVHRDDLALANSRLQAGLITLDQLAGPPIGAALFAAGREWPFVAQAVLVAAGVLLVSRVVLPAHGRETGHATSTVLRDVAEGVRWTVHHPAVRTLSLTILIFNVTFGAAWSVLVLYAQQRLGLGAVGFGLITMVGAAGGLLGTGLYGVDHATGEPRQRDAGGTHHRDVHPSRPRGHHLTVARLGDLLRFRRPRVHLGHDVPHRAAAGRPGPPAGPGQQREHHQHVRRPGRGLRARRGADHPVRGDGAVLVRLRGFGGLPGPALA
jgi:MFS family permease